LADEPGLLESFSRDVETAIPAGINTYCRGAASRQGTYGKSSARFPRRVTPSATTITAPAS
jgi:hypothetical protein